MQENFLISKNKFIINKNYLFNNIYRDKLDEIIEIERKNYLVQ
jgi:hypothetical protein